MSIRPIDLVTIAPKSQEASQMHFNDMRGRDHAQIAASQNFQKTEQHDSKRTVQTAKGETKAYEFDAKDSSGNAYYGSDKKKNNEQHDNDNAKKKRRNTYASGFDIKI